MDTITNGGKPMGITQATRNRNARRASWALKGLETFAKEVGQTIKADGLETVASDFLADLMHLCDREGLDLADLMERAKGHYEAELKGE